ncbi:hypothetical protein [Solibacillus silvestris]|uniref:hypothetical protein n=1 Tax=Solibacillus silvestris TaxID=76853 RepID=UPI0002FC345E|nr:hypothetical protein [Solibacillus silvestris]
MGKTDFYIFLNNFFSNGNLVSNNLKCPTSSAAEIPEGIGYKIPAENNSYTKVCIEKAVEEEDKYKRVVSFRSDGWVNNKKQTTHFQVVVGTDAIPDQLRYAVSSNDSGSLYFHGGVEVTGDIKSAANIHVSKKAYSGWDYNPSWHDSVALKLNPTIGSISSKIIFSESTSKLFYYNQSLSHTSSGPNRGIIYSPTVNNTFSISNHTQIKSLLTKSEKLNVLSKVLTEDVVDVESEVEKIYYENKYTSTLKGANITGHSSNLNKSKESVTLIYNDCISYSNNKPYSCVKYGLGETQLNIKSLNTAEIQGTYYINGNVNIENVNLKSNAILYVNGDVNIRFSTLTELKKDSSLIIFASGSIFIANISEYSNTPSTIKGFFYSQNDMTLYGVGSNIKIIGGIASKNLYLTALRGNVSNNNFKVNETTQLNSDSRLQIIYDENIIKQYTDFRRDEKEEFITQLNEPEVIKRY